MQASTVEPISSEATYLRSVHVLQAQRVRTTAHKGLLLYYRSTHDRINLPTAGIGTGRNRQSDSEKCSFRIESYGQNRSRLSCQKAQGTKAASRNFNSNRTHGRLPTKTDRSTWNFKCLVQVKRICDDNRNCPVSCNSRYRS